MFWSLAIYHASSPFEKHFVEINDSRPGPEVIKLFSCSTQLSMRFILLINVKMPTSVGILTFMSGKNSILSFSEPLKKPNFLISL